MPHLPLHAPARWPLLAAVALGLTACAHAPRPLTAPAPSATTVSNAAAEPAPPAGPTAAGGASAPSRAVAKAPAPRRAGTSVAAAPAAAEDRSAHWHTPGTTFDLDVHDFETQERVQRYVRLFSGPARASFAEQLERGTRYETMIRGRLRAAGLPEDMYYLALVESGFDPQATSRVNAVGMWQFMAATARDVGLRVDWWVDERRDPVRATDAAIRTMRWLRSQFGSMFLAAAAYNGGEGRVSRGLAQLAVADSVRADSARAESTRVDLVAAEGEDVVDTVVTDGGTAAPLGDGRFFALASAGYLRDETKNYVPQLIAATLVAKEPTRYGLVVRAQRAFAYDSVRVSPLVPLAAVARAAEASREQILDLNPHLLRGVTPPGASTLVRVPVGSGASAARRLDDAPAGELRAFRRVVTKKHDTYAAIAEREDVPARLVARYNPSLETVSSGKWKGRIVSGQPVRLPTRAALAYAREVPETESGSLAALPMPSAPREERPASPTHAGAVAPRARSKAVSADDDAPRSQVATAATKRAKAVSAHTAAKSAKRSTHAKSPAASAHTEAKKKAPAPKGRRVHD